MFFQKKVAFVMCVHMNTTILKDIFWSIIGQCMHQFLCPHLVNMFVSFCDLTNDELDDLWRRVGD